jgi:hypothetical protein
VCARLATKFRYTEQQCAEKKNNHRKKTEMGGNDWEKEKIRTRQINEKGWRRERKFLGDNLIVEIA